MIQKTSRKGKQNKFKIENATLDIYKFYRNKSKNPVDIKTFRRILKEGNSKIIDKIVLEGGTFKLPYELGIMYIKRIDPRSVDYFVPIDFKTTSEVGETVPFSNFHSNFVRYRILWRKGLVKGIKPYSFVPTRYFKRLLAYAIKTLKIKY